MVGYGSMVRYRVPGDVHNIFTRHNCSRSGQLDHHELQNALEALSLDHITSNTAEELKRYDRNGNGLLDLDEFYALVRNLREWQCASCPPDVRAAFLQFDRNDNGTLDYDELCTSSFALRALQVRFALCAPCARLFLLSRAICTSALSGARPRHQPAAHGGPAQPLRQGLHRCAHPL